jgi:hypothetical protein
MNDFSKEMGQFLAKQMKTMIDVREHPVTVQSVIESYNRLARRHATVKEHAAIVNQFQEQTIFQNMLTEDERATNYTKWMVGCCATSDPFLTEEESKPKQENKYKPQYDYRNTEHNNKSASEFWNGISSGFHKAFPEGESKEDQHRKGEEARGHFRRYLNTKWGLKPKNTANLLSGGIGKLKMNEKQGLKTKGLALAPHTSSGIKHTLCSHSTGECRTGCLGSTVGNNVAPDVILSKAARTHYMADHPEHFARLLHHEVGEHYKAAAEEGNHAGVRLNTTADVDWARHMPKKFFTDYESHHPTAVTEEYKEDEDPNMNYIKNDGPTFYDYTADPSRVKNDPTGHPELNYHLTLSHKGPNSPTEPAVAAHLGKGGVSAMAYHAKMKREYTGEMKKGKRRWKLKPTNMPHTVHDVANDKYYKSTNGMAHDVNFLAHKEAGVHPVNGAIGKDHEGKERRFGPGVARVLPFKGIRAHSAETAGFASKVDEHGVMHFNYPKQKSPFKIM